jgi:hypothetical protein
MKARSLAILLLWAVAFLSGIPASTQAQTTNLALNKPVTVDSTYNSGYPGANAVDGDRTTNGSRWLSANNTNAHWIEVNLGASYSVSQVKFWTGWEGYNNPIPNYKLQRWSGSAWVDIVSRTGNTNAQVTETFGAVTTSRVRLYNSPGILVRLYEIEIYGTAFVPPTNTPAPADWLNVSQGRPATADSTFNSSYPPANAVDGGLSDASRWLSTDTPGPHWLEIDLTAEYTLGCAHVHTGFGAGDPVSAFDLQWWNGSAWQTIPGASTGGNTQIDLRIVFASTVTTTKVRFYTTINGFIRVKEVKIFTQGSSGSCPALTPSVTPTATPVPVTEQRVYVNQSGYNLNKPKRFTAPNADASATFEIRKQGQSAVVSSGNVVNKIGDFTTFNPTDIGPYVITVTGTAGVANSVPFNIAPYWIERVSYQRAVDFMVDARCYVGTDNSCGNAYAWRDGDTFSFEMQSLVAQYFSNPSAYARMPIQGPYVAGYGVSAPPAANAPDIVRLMHWGTDRYLKMQANHTLFKEQLAYFLYAYPEMKEYIPVSMYNTVRDYLFPLWGNPERTRYTSTYDIPHTADLFQTYTVIGTGKGSFPPGHSIMPNLMMYEVALREGRSDAQLYFNAAYNNTQWIITSLDWNDPTTTKGQRMSERITMEALSYFQRKYPAQAPAGLLQKITDWANIMIARSDNMWDFRRYSNTGWTIPSYNEPGNVAGFPAAAFAASQVISDNAIKDRLRQIAWAHVDNVFGRNPSGRHFSHDAATANGFEGVELGWYMEHAGGIGQLNAVRGVLDGSPKSGSYPFNPNADLGYTEGWVAFNTAWNSSLAYMAYEDTDVRAYNQSFGATITSVSPGTTFGVQLKAPLNFNYISAESGVVVITSSSGDALKLTVTENGANTSLFRSTVQVSSGAVNTGDSVIQAAPGGTITISYGFGIFKRSVTLTVN